MSDDFLTKAFGVVSGVQWDEVPVGVEEFVTSEDFLDLPPLSEYQYQLVKASTQIYKKETLVALYGPQKGTERWSETYNEVVMMLGKGSGKDHCSVIACCYVVYLLLCLSDPAQYYDYPKGEPIDLVNIAINADQAQRVFFKRFKERIERCPWFYGKYKAGMNTIEFNKNITLHSGHSERESFEGLNLIFAVLDEISGFALESNTGNQSANTAHETYKTYRESVNSRYSKYGKVVLLSWPRFPGDYIQQRYGGYDDEKKGIIGAVGGNGTARNIKIRQHTFKLDEDLPDGIPSNEFSIEWEEDEILAYSLPGVFALRRPSWEMNPTKSIDDYKISFYTNKADALMRFACMPTTTTDDTFIKDQTILDRSFITFNGVSEDGIFARNFNPKPDVNYYVHVDLSKVHDRCAVGLAHVDKWITHENDPYSGAYPMIRVDALRWWEPSHEQPMDYKEVIDYILSLRRKGFNIKLVTFDRWNSVDTMNTLRDKGIEVDRLSVDTEHYDDFLSVLYDERLIGPQEDKLVDELKNLKKFMKGSKIVIDHPRQGYKDMSDAVCGAVYNAIEHTVQPSSRDVEIKSYADLQREAREEKQTKQPAGVIRPPRAMPQEFRDQMEEISEQDIVQAMRIL